MEHKEFETYLKETTKEIIIFGTGKMSEYLYESCKKNNLVLTAFCDNNSEKWNQENNGIPIFSLDTIKKKYRNALFLVSPWDEEPQKNIISQLQQNGYDEFYTIHYCIDNMKQLIISDPPEKLALYNYRMKQNKVANAPLLHIDTIDFVITEKCSLNCRDCGNFMPYYENPITYEKEDLFQSIDRLDYLFDSIGILRILGGEPLLHPDLFEIIAYAQSKKTIAYVAIITNCTIVPKQSDLSNFNLDFDRFTVSGSNYGSLSIKYAEVEKFFQEAGIIFSGSLIDIWDTPSKFQYLGESEDVLQQRYSACVASECVVLMNQKLFHCPILAASHHLKSLPKTELEFIDMMNDNKTKEELKSDIKQYLYGTTHLKICNWCVDILAREEHRIKPAIQIKGKMLYKKYLD